NHQSFVYLKSRLGNIDSNYFDRVHVVLPQVERSQPKYETDRAEWGCPSHHYAVVQAEPTIITVAAMVTRYQPFSLLVILGTTPKSLL
ncbi:hypothetical protein ACEUAM_22795, partial [Aeromonas hydrophila]|uniref:hypothetical protein n=1 Tax=Aeromonas hydrophila TaxID=644 RepID=UPI0038D180AC